MNVVTKKLAELRMFEKNVRRHNDKQIKEYARSLEKFKQIRPMVIDENNVILVGNGMYEAMKRLGWESAACEVVTGLSENDKKKLMLADNRVYELGMTDMDVFDDIIRELGEDLDVPGWDEDLLQTITSSMADANAMVESYGVFSPEEVVAVQERQREDHTQYVQPSEPIEALQRPMGAVNSTEQVFDRQTNETATEPKEELNSRFIICPHCGERILLTPDLIGGM